MTQPQVSHLVSGTIAVSVPLPFLQKFPTSAASPIPLQQLCRQALQTPVGFPELWQCVIPGDNVVIAADPETPNLADVLSLLHEELGKIPEGGVALTLVLAPDPSGQQWQPLRESIPLHLRQQLNIVDHDPGDRTHVSYVASSTSGERLYLNRHLAEADLIITVGFTRFDPSLGVRGTSSCLFPAFTDTETLVRTGFATTPGEITSTVQARRQLVDELGRLTGTQFTLQLIHGPQGPLQVLAGQPDQVFEQSGKLNQKLWSITVDEPADAILTSIPAGPAAWQCFGQALENLLEIVDQGGRIIVISDLDQPEGPAATLLRRTQDPEELLRPLKKEHVADGNHILQLIEALRRARVYLLSRLPPEVVEELGMIPLASETELLKLLTTIPQCLVLPNAHCARCKLS
jgi:nickel-dependent lactate racemase